MKYMNCGCDVDRLLICCFFFWSKFFLCLLQKCKKHIRTEKEVIGKLSSELTEKNWVKLFGIQARNMMWHYRYRSHTGQITATIFVISQIVIQIFPVISQSFENWGETNLSINGIWFTFYFGYSLNFSLFTTFKWLWKISP